MENLTKFIGAITAFLLLILYGAFSRGFILYKFWYWFIIPVFATIPHITISAAVGLMFVIGLFKPIEGTEHYINDVKIEEKPAYALLIIFPWIVLVMGWFIHLFI